MNHYIKIVIIVYLLICISNKINKPDSFTSSNIPYKKKINDIYINKHIFKSGVSYSDVKKIIPWIDTVIYDDLYKASLDNDLSITYIEKIVNNII